MTQTNDINKISFIVPVHRSENSVRLLLRSIYNQKLTTDNFEVILVFNPENKLFEKILLNDFRFDNLIILHSDKINANSARNLAAKKAKFDNLYFLDDDCGFSDNFSTLKVSTLCFPNTCTGGYYITRIQQNKYKKLFFLALYYFLTNLIYNTWVNLWLLSTRFPGRSKFFVAGNFIVFKPSFLKAGGFNEKLSSHGEELDLFLRLNKLNLKFKLNHNLSVVHMPNRTLVATFLTMIAQVRRRHLSKLGLKT